MGEALVPFSDPKDAQSFEKDQGGSIFSFEDITMDMLSPAKYDHPRLDQILKTLHTWH
jgi:nitrous oxide reductase accessory protein NosL